MALPLSSRIVRISAGGLAKLGLSAEPPYRALRLARIARDPVEYVRRRRIGQALRKVSRWRDMIPRETACRLVPPDELPGTGDLLAACRAVAAMRLPAMRELERPVKPFFINVMRIEDLRAHPEIVGFVASAALLEAIAAYLGSLPRLRALGLYVSPASESQERSQRWHVDYDDFRQIKVFVNVEPVDEDTGPFTFLPADRSAVVRAALGHGWKHTNLDDGAAATECPVRLLGPAGQAGLIDTSRCLHYGSRVRSGLRLVFMAQYLPQPHVTPADDKAGLDGRPLFEFPEDVWPAGPEQALFGPVSAWS